MFSITCGIQKIKQMNEYNKTETDSQRNQTSGYQRGEGRKEGQDRGGDKEVLTTTHKINNL